MHCQSQFTIAGAWCSKEKILNPNFANYVFHFKYKQ